MRRTTYPLYLLLLPQYWPSWCIVGCLWILSCFPLSWQLAVGRGIGRLMYRLAHEMRRTARINLSLCFPDLLDDEREAWVKANFISAGLGFVESGMAWWGSDRRLAPYAHFEGLSHLQEALDKGQGVLMIGAHMSILQMTGRLLSGKIPFTVVYRRQKNPVFDFIIARAYRKYFDGMLLREDVRGIVRALKEHKIVWYTPDTDPGRKSSVFSPFFGKLAATVTAPTRLAGMTGAKLLTLSFYRREGGKRYDIVLSPIIKNFPTDDIEQDTAYVNTLLEDIIKQEPTQYLWQYKRFKTQPEGHVNPYSKKLQEPRNI